MQAIRNAVVEEKSLSTCVHNVKIISQNGKVALTGPVRSEDEKRTIEAKTTKVAATGATTGGAIGSTLGLLAGIGSLAIPGADDISSAGEKSASTHGVNETPADRVSTGGTRGY